MRTKRILVATISEYFPLIERVYTSPEFNTSLYTSIEEIKKVLDEGFDLIDCSIHFNNGQFYELLKLAKAHPRVCHIPFVVALNGKESILQNTSLGIEVAAKTLGADALIPVSKWSKEYGKGEVPEKYRQFVSKFIS